MVNAFTLCWYEHNIYPVVHCPLIQYCQSKIDISLIRRYFGFVYKEADGRSAGLTKIPSAPVQETLFAHAKLEIELLLSTRNLQLFRKIYGSAHEEAKTNCGSVREEMNKFEEISYLECLNSERAQAIDTEYYTFHMPTN